MKNLRRPLLLSIYLACLPHDGLTVEKNGAGYTIVKDLLGSSGHARLESPDYGARYAWGEPTAGHEYSNSDVTLMSGYYAGGFSNGSRLRVESTRLGDAAQRLFIQDGLQVGIQLHAPVAITFSDDIDAATLESSVEVRALFDHEARPVNSTHPVALVYDNAARTLTITPQPAWNGNTLYMLTLSQALRNLDDQPLSETYSLRFATLLNPSQDNVVRHPVDLEAFPAPHLGALGAVSVELPRSSLSDYSAVLVSRDPLLSPILASAPVIEEANAKSMRSGGLYRRPLLVQEVVAFDRQGDVMHRLQSQATLSVSYNEEALREATQGLVRPETLSWWALDAAHRLWVKIPQSQHARGTFAIRAPIANFTTFALIGEPAGSAAHSYAFPVPWRPHGPRAGSGQGQTGTETGGITFSNIPSECRIRIFTLAGEEVRVLVHSDLAGRIAQEAWDVKNARGEPVASGVYLWSVESTQDTQQGKLVIIR